MAQFMHEKAGSNVDNLINNNWIVGANWRFGIYEGIPIRRWGSRPASSKRCLMREGWLGYSGGGVCSFGYLVEQNLHVRHTGTIG